MTMTGIFERWGTPLMKTLILSGAVLMSSCTETRYVDLASVHAVDEYPYRTVAYRMDREFFDHFPNCVLILPPRPASVSRELTGIIEAALARHLALKFDRVIDVRERNNAAEVMNVDPADDRDRDVLARKLDCDAYLETGILNPRFDYLLVWSRVGVGLDLRLKSTSTGTTIWQARHEASRSEGGVSFSPLGVLLDSASSARFTGDREVAEGIVEDAVRRMTVPLPNLRTY